MRLLSEGGDERIVIDPSTGLNRYLCAPRPSNVLAFASTTANDLSAGALVHLQNLPLVPASPTDYAARLELLRWRIRSAYRLDGTTAVVFSPSGTDLEYVALACTPAGDRPVTNILLGADEVGSGCIHSANGQHFARRTPLGIVTEPGVPVPGLAEIDVVSIAVRDEDGRPRSSADIADAIDEATSRAQAHDRHVLAHVVHGSKTGLVVPSLDDLDRLGARWGEAVTWVVDACQARISPAAVQAYLARGSIVLLTGSKFVGAPPFCGFALVPQTLVAAAEPLKRGLGKIFRQAEWPAGWPGAELMSSGSNPGLLLRLEAALFEIERYRALDEGSVRSVIGAFGQAVQRLADRLGAALIADHAPRCANREPELDTMVALDLANLVEGSDFDDASCWHRALVRRGIRLGQPVRCARLPDGRWGPTLRVALSMPMIVERAGDCGSAADRFAQELGRVGTVLAECAGSPGSKSVAASVAA